MKILSKSLIDFLLVDRLSCKYSSEIRAVPVGQSARLATFREIGLLGGVCAAEVIEIGQTRVMLDQNDCDLTEAVLGDCRLATGLPRAKLFSCK